MSAAEREALKAKRRGGRALSDRYWRRIRILELLDRGWKLSQTAVAVGTYPREVRRIGSRYLERGLEAALTDDPRPKPDKMLDSAQQAAIVAMVCGPRPAGHARWTIVLTAREAQRRRVVAIGWSRDHPPLFLNHELKPWGEKNWCVPALNHNLPRADGGGAAGAEPTAR